MKVALSKDAQKQFQRLPLPEQKKVNKKLLSLEQNPLSGKKLSGELQGVYTLRAWPYRILYEINALEKRIEIHKILHRQGSYK